MRSKYAFQDFVTDTMARAKGTDLSISFKQSQEICKHIRGKMISRVYSILDDAIALKRAIPFTRFTNGLGHKSGIGSGRYCIKACTAIKQIVKAAEANAKNKGLGDQLKLKHICAHLASQQWHYGRQRRRQMKRTHIEVVLLESEKKKSAVKKEVPKTEVKKETPKEEEPKSKVKKEKPKGEVKKETPKKKAVNPAATSPSTKPKQQSQKKEEKQ